MPNIRFTETYLSSSIIIITTSNLMLLEKELESFNNVPEFIDETLVIDLDKSNNRKNPELSFIHFEQVHDGSLYPIDNSESIDLGDLIFPYIAQGSTFKLQFAQLEGSGIHYTSFSYDATGLINQFSDNPLVLDSKYL